MWAQPSTVNPAAATLSWGQTLLVAGITAVAVLASGLIVLWARSTMSGKGRKEPAASFVRSWIAVGLVVGLVLFCAFTFAVDDTALRSTLIGALTASVGAAVAFYFSTKSSEQARQDLLNATVGTETVPNLDHKSHDDAKTALGMTSLKFELAPGSPTTGTVSSQQPPAGTVALKGSSVVVTLTGT
ncbi:hypothetical protein GCM10023094_09680 [Rhodococcus olei]|uniref:PASTA domain-containing protein n=1 Tax=Rhodococcus olei TaxID=2161675 RepID=A0ABP8NYG7_9NOCA